MVKTVCGVIIELYGKPTQGVPVEKKPAEDYEKEMICGECHEEFTATRENIVEKEISVFEEKQDPVWSGSVRKGTIWYERVKQYNSSCPHCGDESELFRSSYNPKIFFYKHSYFLPALAP
jgi:ribosomal protein S27AE